MKTSEMYSLDMKDLGKGLIVAVGGAAVTAIQGVLSTGALNFNWKAIGLTALAAGLSYLAKNFFTPAQTIINSGSGNIQ